MFLNINRKKIKESLTKGFVLLTLTGTLVSKNPINSYKEKIVYASVDLNQSKKNAVKELKNIYKKYKKSYYSSKNYNKLTKIYNKGCSLINKSNSLDKIEGYLKTYKEKMISIKPTKLVSYQKKMEKSLLKTYKALITKYTYSENNLEKIENIKDEGINEIYNSTTKTKSKKNKNNYIKKLKEVKSLVVQVKEDAIIYVKHSKKINEENKNILLEQINNMTKEENIISLLEEYGYKYEEEEEYVETNPNKLTLDILNDEEKLSKFITDWYDGSEHVFSQDSQGNLRYLGEPDIRILIEAINYQYFDSNKTMNEYYKREYEVSKDKGYEYFKTHTDHLSYYIFRMNELDFSEDYDSLIIENDEIKGVGKLIQKMIDNFVKNKDITDVFKKYMDKYMGKNYALDSIVDTIMITQGYISYFLTTDSGYSDEETVLYDNKKKFRTILEEYFYGTEDYFNNYS